MVRTGPRSKLAEVERAIIEVLLSSQARAHGMGFREIYRNIQAKLKVGSFSTLGKGLRNLEENGIVRKSVVTGKYFFEEISFAHYDRDLVMEAIAKSNVLGGGRLFHPDTEIPDNGIRLPPKKPEIFAAVDVFIQANIKGIYGWPDEGVQFIETFEGAWPGKKKKLHDAKETSKIGREPLHFESLAMRRLNASKTVRDWVISIWDYAKENELVNHDLTLDKASKEDLERIWKEMFEKAHVKTIVLTEFVNPQKLLEWLKTPSNMRKVTQ